MARPGQAVWSNLANLGGVVKRRSHVKARRRAVQRQAFIERLEPRVVLNGAPVAVPDPWYTTPQNTTLTVTTQGTTLVANDWDPEGSAITASLVSGPSNGTLSSLQADGTFTYTPNYRLSRLSIHSSTG